MITGHNAVDVEYANYFAITDETTLFQYGQHMFDFTSSGEPRQSYSCGIVRGMKCIFVPRTTVGDNSFFRPLWAIPKSLIASNALKMTYSGQGMATRSIVNTNSTLGGQNDKLYYWSTGGWSYRNDVIINSAMGYIDVVSEDLVAAASAFIAYFSPNVNFASYPSGVVQLTKVSGDVYGETFVYRVTADSSLYSGISLSVANLETDVGISDVTITTTYSNTDYEFSFTMPVEGAKIVANAEKKSYNITYASSQFGTVTGPTSKKWEETVTVTATPNAGYTVSGVLVTNGQETIEVTRTGDNTFTFVMPTGNVTVSASYNDKLSVVWNVRPANLGNVIVNGISEYRKATDAPTSYTQIASSPSESLSIYTDADVYWGRVSNVIYFASRSQFTIYERLTIDGYNYNHSVTPSSINDSTGVNLYYGSLTLQYSSITSLPMVFSSFDNFVQAAANRVVNGVVKIYEPNSAETYRVETLASYEVSTISINNNNVEYDFNRSTGIGSFIMPNIDTDVIIYISLDGDPNSSGGNSQPNTPIGGFDNQSDIIPIPSWSDVGIVNQVPGKGMITLWNPTVSEIADIGDFLYATDWGQSIYQGFRDFFVKPLESAISLHVLPITPSRSSSKKNIRFGPHNSGVYSYQITEQYKTVDLGVLYIEPYWDSYLDYNPFTKLQIFLPYIGTQDIDIDIVMGKYIGVRYKFDIMTGACVAYLYTYENNTASVFAEFVGEAAMQLPLCSSDYSRVPGGIIQAAATVVTGRMVTGAAMKSSEGLVAAKSVELEQASNRLDTAMKKRPRTESGKAAKEAAIAGAQEAKDKAADGLRAVPYEVGSVMNGKANFTISGSVAGGAGLLGSQKPYIIIKRPKQSLADNYQKYVGYPSNIYAILGTLSGYTRIEQADLTGIPCTDAELAMIYKALKEGVYL